MDDNKSAKNKSTKIKSLTSSTTINDNGRNNEKPKNQKKSIKNVEEKNKANPEMSEDDDDMNDGGEEEMAEEDQEVDTIGQSSSDFKPKKVSYSNKTQRHSSLNFSSTQKLFLIAATVLIAILLIKTFSSSNNNNWRSKIDLNNVLSNDQQYIVRASLKPILDKSPTEDEGVSTLLILSSNEESAMMLAQCLLKLVNQKTHKDQLSTEIDLRSHRGGKLELDSHLRSLLDPTGAIRAVLLRRIDEMPSNDAFDQLRLLFAYCDGENPVIPHRLIIMTATSNSVHESELREKFKSRWPQEHDFVDALMSRISGHTLYVEKDQKSIC